MPAPKYDWTSGTRYGRLTLTGKSYYTKNKHYVECLCDCGTILYKRYDELKKGGSTYCGSLVCKNQTSINKGDIYGRLELTGEYRQTSNKGILVTCKCSCGVVVEKTLEEVMAGRVKSCGNRECVSESKGLQPIKEIYGFLKLTGKEEYRRNGIRYLEAVCVCGEIKFYNISSLKSGKVKSCGCKRGELCAPHSTTHGCTVGGSRHPIYESYLSMRNRCINPKDAAYYRYGGANPPVTICDEWLNDFQSFLDWSLANGWKPGLQIDKDIKGDGTIYGPDSCMWATSLEQNRHRKDNFIITAFGETKCLSAWVADKRCKIGANGLKKRIKRGWPTEKSISTPNTRKYAIAI